MAHINSGPRLTAVVEIARMLYFFLVGASFGAAADTVVSADAARAIGAFIAVRRRIIAVARILEINAVHAVAERVAMPAAVEVIYAVDIAVRAADLGVKIRLVRFPLLKCVLPGFELGRVRDL